MPSDRPQLNFRPDPETYALWVALLPRVSAATGVRLSQSQLMTLAVQALAEKYPAPAEDPTPAPAPKATRKAPARKRSG